MYFTVYVNLVGVLKTKFIKKNYEIESFKILGIFRLSLANPSGCLPPWPVGTDLFESIFDTSVDANSPDIWKVCANLKTT
jgi:hypothetical protein